jgi:hypothetical protein
VSAPEKGLTANSHRRSTGLLTDRGVGRSTGSRPPAGPRSPGVAITAEPCGPTRAEAMVESGLLDIAAGISNLASLLTVAAITSIENRMSERGRRASADHVEFLREAIFYGITRQLIERAEQRPKADPQKNRANISSSPPTTIATTVAPLRPALITIPAACAYLNVSKSTFYERVLPNLEIVHLLSNKPLIKLDSLDHLIAAKTVAAGSFK